MDKSNEIELLQAQLIQERALVQDLEAGKSKMILDAIEVGGQFSDLREAVRVLKEVLQFVMLKAPGYDWNTDPLSITLMVGNAFTKSNHVLAGEPDEENDSLQAQLTQRTGQIAALQARVRELEQWVQDQSTANLETMRHTDEMQSRALEAEQQLTQHKSELEAANTLLYKKNCALWRAETSINDLQAELERVRGLIKALADEDAALYAALLQHRQGME